MYRFNPLGPGFHHGPGAFGWLFLAILMALLVVAVVALVRVWRTPHRAVPFWRMGPPPGAPFDPALGELRLRYARGEIGSEEYWRRATDLGGPFHAPPPGHPAAGPPAAPSPRPDEPPTPSTAS